MITRIVSTQDYERSSFVLTLMIMFKPWGTSPGGIRVFGYGHLNFPGVPPLGQSLEDIPWRRASRVHHLQMFLKAGAVKSLRWRTLE